MKLTQKSFYYLGKDFFFIYKYYIFNQFLFEERNFCAKNATE